MRMANEMTNYKAVTITGKKHSRTQKEDESLNYVADDESLVSHCAIKCNVTVARFFNRDLLGEKMINYLYKHHLPYINRKTK